ncbi:hypothetical protein [Candidatus Amarolinea dominans]|uniref:hypothetical protein n=1 Tax=Candidatus Amarolinea dominans TaxID=3140696 RepID=UPI001DF59788|nr:hypothetical protein [Anaerolineae bacterium]
MPTSSATSAQVRHLGFRSTDRIILHLPMNHASGAVLITVGAMFSGAPSSCWALSPVETSPWWPRSGHDPGPGAD